MIFHIGTGSWADPEYKKLLAAPDVPAKERLRAYTAWFDHVELNASYHHIPTPRQTAAWLDQTPAGFTFDVRLHRDLCQNPQLAATDEGLIATTIESARPLIEAGRFGCFLLVLPPSFTPAKRSLELLDALVARLEPQPLAVELRHNAWVSGEQREKTLAYFRARRLVWVAVDLPQVEGTTLMPPIDEVTREDIAYLRLHGRNPRYHALKSAEEKHTYAYSAPEIAEIASRARALAAKAQHVHLSANNHAEDFAPKTALALQRLLRPDRHGPVSQPAG
ncbi:MAG TPA: DUF72 domain-containing protein [Opitutaceae bacterium]